MMNAKNLSDEAHALFLRLCEAARKEFGVGWADYALDSPDRARRERFLSMMMIAWKRWERRYKAYLVVKHGVYWWENWDGSPR